MSHCLSNLTFSLPISSPKTRSSSKLVCPPKLPLSVNPIRNSRNRGRLISIKANTRDARENLDHLQRSSKGQPQQQPKRRVAQVSPVGLWDRFPTARTVQQMMDTMERMIEDPIAAYGTGPFPTESPAYSRGRTPWEIKEGEGEYKMRFDMPGMTKVDVKVWVEDKMLVVKAEKVPKKREGQGTEEEEEGEWSAKSFGRYSFRIALPDNVEVEKIKAEVRDGVVYITIPKASPSAKVFDINVE